MNPIFALELALMIAFVWCIGEIWDHHRGRR